MNVKQTENKPIELYERLPRFSTLEEIEAALQAGIYGSSLTPVSFNEAVKILNESNGLLRDN